MTFRTSLAVVALLSSGAAAHAQDQTRPAVKPRPSIVAATTAEDCLKHAFELADKIEGKELTEAQFEKLDEMLSAMESHCENNQFADAASVANDISTAIETRKQ